MDKKSKRTLIGGIVIAALALAALVICVSETARATYDTNISARQTQLHEAAELLRSLGIDEDSEAIAALSNEWWRCELHVEAEYIAKTLYGEARGCSRTEQEAVVWCILNRADAWGMNVVDVITAPGQFAGYRESNPVWPELYDVAQYVLAQWRAERNGESADRVLPREYLWFSGNGTHNVFRDAYKGGNVWVAE